MKKPIIHLFTFCYNEEKIIPYFFRHYLRFVDKITVYDSYSTDSSKIIIKKYPRTEIKKYDTNNQINDRILMNMKNNIWKTSRGKADYVMVCDMDEFLYHPKIIHFLNKLKENGYTLIKPFGYDMISKSYPETKKQIYEKVRSGVANIDYSKTVLFNPNEINEINFAIGAHSVKPLGNIKLYRGDEYLKLLHFKYLSVNYLLDKHRNYKKRFSEENKRNKWGLRYIKKEIDTKKMFNEIYMNKSRVI